MKIGKGHDGFTLVENVIALALVSTICLSFIGGLILSGKMAGWSRNSMEAAEIIDSKLEGMRAHSWGQIHDLFATPQTFHVTNGIVYAGLIEVQQAPAAGPYQNELIEVTVSVSWEIDGRTRELRGQTYISPYGFSADGL